MGILINGQVGWRSATVVGAPAGQDADALAFITAASITDSTQASAVNTLVVDLKSANIWTKMKAIYPFVGGSATSHKFNLKDPRDLDVAYRLTFNGGWTHSTSGAQPNGTTGYANTYLKPSVSLSINDMAFGFYSRTNVDYLSSDMGGSVQDYASTELNIYPRYGNSVYFRVNSSDVALASTNTSSLGLYTANRVSSTQTRNMINGNLIVQNANSVTVNSSNMYIGAVGTRDGGTRYSARQLAFSFISTGLTDTEAANFYTAVQAYQTTLGRQV